jgi:hypothetical protein
MKSSQPARQLILFVGSRSVSYNLPRHSGVGCRRDF